MITPHGLWLTVNRTCNMRCRWCYAEGTDYKKSDMPIDLAKKLVDLAKELGLHYVTVIGGEPTLYPHLFELNDYAKQREINTILVTNGKRFSSDAFWKEYLKHPSTMPGISIKAGSGEQFAQLTQTQGFEETEKGIARVIEHFSSGISVTYNAFYTDNFMDIVRTAKQKKAENLKIDFCTTCFTDKKPSNPYLNLRQTAQHIISEYEEANAIMEGKIVYEINIPFCLFPLEFIEKLIERKQIVSICHVIKNEGVVFTHTGNLLMCNILFDFPIGKYGVDFTTGKELVAFLNSPVNVSYYRRMRAYPHTDCKQCKMWKYCGGGCPLRWAIENPKEICIPFL